MKTSNKILLGVFIAVILIMTSIHVALFAKYKSGDFVSAKDAKDETHTTISLPVIKHLSVTGMENVQLLTSHSVGANGRSELIVENRPDSRFAYRVVGDTLFLVGDSTIGNDALERGERNHQDVNVSMPLASHVRVAYGSLMLFGTTDSIHAPSYSVELTRYANLRTLRGDPNARPVYFNRLDLVANNSEVVLEQGTEVNHLNVQARTSTLVLKQSTIGQIQLDVDPESVVTLVGKNFKDINVKSQP